MEAPAVLPYVHRIEWRAGGCTGPGRAVARMLQGLIVDVQHSAPATTAELRETVDQAAAGRSGPFAPDATVMRRMQHEQASPP